MVIAARLASLLLLAVPVPALGAAPGTETPPATPAAPDAEVIPRIRLAVPVLDPAFDATPVARVEGEPILLEDFADGLQEVHKGGGHEGAPKLDFKKMVDRLINVRLVVAEARAMGLDETDEAKEGLPDGRDRILIRMLQERATAGVEADPKEVDRLFKQASREWLLRSVLFKTEADAKALMAAVSKGKPFLQAVEQAVKEKGAEQTEPGGFVKPSDLAPQVAAAIAVLAKGQATPPLKVGQHGYSIVRLEDVRHPEDPKALAEAQAQALAQAHSAALKKAYAEMEKRHLVKNEALLKQVSFDKPKGGPDALEKDTRVLARVKGGKDLTVGELAKGLHARLYHGVSEAQKVGRLDKDKFAAFDSITSQRVLALEGARLGIPATAEYKKAVRSFETSYLFGAFVSKVVAPDIEVKQEAVKAWYEAHQADYMYPAFYRLDTLAFDRLDAAKAAAAKLKQGTDFAFLQANAEGLLPPGKATLAADPSALLSAKGIPAELAKVLEGARPGDIRVHSAAPDQHYVVQVRDVVPPRPQPLEQVNGPIQNELFGQALTRSMDDWFAKLRAARKVESYLEP